MELTPQGDKTELTLIHQGFPDKDSADKHRAGWGSALEKLEAALGG